MAEHRRIRILALAGSYRQGSFNQALLRAAEEAAPAEAGIDHFDLRELPFFDADLESTGDPERVVAFKTAVRESDALLVATPEYNGSIPAVLKNGIDWASRGYPDSPLRDKPAAIVGATPGRGGTARAQAHLREILERVGVLVLENPTLQMARAAEHITDDRLETADIWSTLHELVDTLVHTAGLGADSGSRAAMLAGCGG